MKHAISIDRQSKSWAVFDENSEIAKPFVPYTDEAAAIAEAEQWCDDRGITADERRVVYPSITSFRTSIRKTLKAPIRRSRSKK